MENQFKIQAEKSFDVFFTQVREWKGDDWINYKDVEWSQIENWLRDWFFENAYLIWFYLQSESNGDQLNLNDEKKSELYSTYLEKLLFLPRLLLGKEEEIIDRIRNYPHLFNGFEKLHEISNSRREENVALKTEILRLKSDVSSRKSGLETLSDDDKDKFRRVVEKAERSPTGVKKGQINPKSDVSSRKSGWESLSDDDKDKFRSVVEKAERFRTGVKKDQINYKSLSVHMQKLFPNGIDGRKLDDKYTRTLCDTAKLD
jgi:hypothetical protein